MYPICNHNTEKLTMMFTASLITAASIASPLPSTTAFDPTFKESFQPVRTPLQWYDMLRQMIEKLNTVRKQINKCNEVM